MAFVEGQSLGPYRILSRLGQGGMATVYKGYHARLDRNVAVKVVHQAYVQEPSALARFEREAQIVARLDHPHIVPIYDFAEHDGQPYLVMKHIDGLTLKALLSQGPLSLDAIIGLMTSVASALDYAHGQGVLHRDIKPSNILIGQDGVPYVTDFGLARIAHAAESTLSENMLLGTPQYISPEQAKGERDLTPQSDLYSLAIVLYELVVGRVPFNADTPYAIVHDQIYRDLPSPREINPNVSPAVEAVLVKALAKDPTDRYPNAMALVEAFRDAVVDIDGASMHQPIAPPVGPSATRTPTPAASPVEPSVPSPASQSLEKPKRDGNVEFRLDFATIGEQLRDAFDGLEQGWSKPDSGPNEAVPFDDEQTIRRRIENSYKKRGEFITHLVVYGAINVMLWVIFLFAQDFTDIGFPWPLIVALGWGSGLLAHGIDTYYQTGARAAAQDRIAHEALRRQYGDDWVRTVSKKEYNKTRHNALKPYRKRVELLQHAVIYLAINVMLWMIFLFTQGFTDIGFPWPLIVGLGWGAGLAGHVADTFLGADARSASRERAVQRELERELSRREADPLDKPKRSHNVRLNEDGEFTDSIVESWQFDEEERSAKR